jgi:hypothetical protein
MGTGLTFGRWSASGGVRRFARMNAQHAGYLGGGVLIAIILLVVLQAPPLVWLVAAIAAIVAAACVVSVVARTQGVDVAHEILARMGTATPTGRPPRTHARGTAFDAASSSRGARATPDSRTAVRAADAPVEMTLVRSADEVAGSVAVWLHRCGGRRVHRYAGDDGWVVEQVSTKDPDNPRKRIIGTPLTFDSEAAAIKAACHLAQGILPRDVDAARALGVPPAATAEARRRRVKLTGQEQARRMATEWGMLAGT